MLNKAQVIVPAAGPNLEFDKSGTHKLLINVYNKKLIQWVQLSRPYDLSKALFVFNKFHEEKFNLVKNISKALGKKIKYKLLNRYTEGAPQTVMKIRDLVKKDQPIFIDLLDQYLDLKGFYDYCIKKKNQMDVCLYFNHFIIIEVMPYLMQKKILKKFLKKIRNQYLQILLVV